MYQSHFYTEIEIMSSHCSDLACSNLVGAFCVATSGDAAVAAVAWVELIWTDSER